MSHDFKDLLKKSCKFIFVTGGVISGLGKGVTTSFLGAVMKGHGYNVTAIKIDPYINIDAGTFSPYEHGEVFVLDDGSEVDLDLGNYERMLGNRLSGPNNITTGKIYDFVIRKERKGDYLGKTVQIVPHVTDEIQRWLLQVAFKSLQEQKTDSNHCGEGICLVEVGGIVGDMESMPFLEAIRQLQTKLTRSNFCHIHISLLPISSEQEHKTKPTQVSIREMKSFGLFPDFIFCRSETDINDTIKKKLSLFCDTPTSNIISLPTMNNLYEFVPKLYQQNIVQNLCLRLSLPFPKESDEIKRWISFADKCGSLNKEVVIAVVGKYTSHKDAYHSISSALFHASVNLDRKLKILWIDSQCLEDSQLSNSDENKECWNKLWSANGILIPGGFDYRGFQGMILAAEYGRKNNIPTFGICLGFQAMVIEYGRNVLNLTAANSTEMDPQTPHPLVIEMPEFNPQHKGGTMRLGLRKTVFVRKDCLSSRLYKTTSEIFERHRHRFEFNVDYRESFQRKGLNFVAEDETGSRMEILELSENDHGFYVGVQFHPEFLSRPLSPSPIFTGFIQASITKSTS